MKADPQLISRLLKTARGQLDGILKMVEEDRYCMDISAQLQATASILKKANTEVLRAHVSSCVRESMEIGTESDRNRKIDELITVIDRVTRL